MRTTGRFAKAPGNGVANFHVSTYRVNELILNHVENDFSAFAVLVMRTFSPASHPDTIPSVVRQKQHRTGWWLGSRRAQRNGQPLSMVFLGTANSKVVHDVTNKICCA